MVRCGRLSWLLVCFWAHVKIVVSYWINFGTIKISYIILEHSCREPEVAVKCCVRNFSKLIYRKVILRCVYRGLGLRSSTSTSYFLLLPDKFCDTHLGWSCCLQTRESVSVGWSLFLIRIVWYFNRIVIILQIYFTRRQISYRWKFAWTAWNRQLMLSEEVRERRTHVARLLWNTMWIIGLW